ncbi:Zn(2)-C6 fungal-type domain-containing protein [Fusarium sp. LHS14.1]|nr:Zn(2)-C6 fungal-type domain-containing protein [Fusarium sp. LHS14.1]
MRSRQAACDPCRKAKLGCDHGRPTCSRCKDQGKPWSCVYRAMPFKRKRTAAVPSPLPEPQESQSPPDDPHETLSPTLSHTPTASRAQLYHNPGHLGGSSHVDIFNQIFLEDSDQDTMNNGTPTTHLSSLRDDQPSLRSHYQAQQGADLIKSLVTGFRLRSLEDLVSFWIKKGINLALAEPFVAMFARHANYSCLSSFDGPDWHLEMASKLLENTNRPLTISAAITL